MNPSFTDAKLRQGHSKKNSRSCSGSLTSSERRYQRFLVIDVNLKSSYTQT